MSGFFPSRLYLPPKDKPKLASGEADVPKLLGKAVEKIVKLIPGEVVAGYSALIYLASNVVRESLHIWLYGIAFLVGLAATPTYLYFAANRQKPYVAQMVLSTIAFVPWAYLTTGKQIMPQHYDSALGGFLVVIFALGNGCIPIKK